ncbi:uncharacterized protein (TIGR02598 family) [Roseimicrobium gellanilyticum]|uniref:Uncharacterized protein (TIGR02598 family) n=1 Tax=Roseimicrobium gellanilyticum TaxID=748857 RepID=A0A366HRF5_9BACT|nr:Verru_Chthon cassette protein B [Roseimicrobium gellanilyticum]RBP46252.1 uncharacterized protein (TIGR02598 family) [Roseimicrobium gellanilyticum]
MQKHPPSITTRAFSLPEVALSLGIATTALLTLISLLPFGLDTLRESSSKQAEARILQSVLDRYQSGIWMEKDSAGGTGNVLLKDRLLYFDQTGTEMEDASSVECDYVVQIHIDGPPTLHGDASDNPYLRRVRVRVSDRPNDPQRAFADGSGHYHEHSVWIALLDQTGPLMGPLHSSEL